MSLNGWEEKRIALIEDRLDELDVRTRGLVRLGPSVPSEEEAKAATKQVTETILAATKAVADAAPPVDRSNRQLTDGSPVPADYSHTQDRGDGMQKGYVVLSADERAKGFVRPVRDSYLHKPCGTVTHMGRALAETYARDPGFYNGTFCCGCRKHFPLDQFVWDGTDEMVGL